MLRRRIRLKRKGYRLGQKGECEVCAEPDLRMLDQVAGSVLCRNCRLAQKGKSIMEYHHPSGRRNDRFVLAMPANEHAILSDYQEDWPEETMRNPNNDTLLQIAAWLRANSDFREHAIERGRKLAKYLERLSSALAKKFGPNWDKNLDLDRDDREGE